MSRLLNVRRTNTKGEAGKSSVSRPFPNSHRFPPADESSGDISIDASTGVPYLSDGDKWVSLRGPAGESQSIGTFPTITTFPDAARNPGKFASDSSTGTPYFSDGDRWRSLKGAKGQPAVGVSTVDRWLALEEDSVRVLKDVVPDSSNLGDINVGSISSPYAKIYGKEASLENYGRFLSVGTPGSSEYVRFGLERQTNRIRIQRGDDKVVYAVTTDPDDPSKIDPAAFRPQTGSLSLRGTADPSADPEFFKRIADKRSGDYYLVTQDGTFDPDSGVRPGDETASKGDLYVYVDSDFRDFEPVDTWEGIPPASISEGKTVYDKSTKTLYLSTGNCWRRVVVDSSIPYYGDSEAEMFEAAFYERFERDFNEALNLRGLPAKGFRMSERDDAFYLATLGKNDVVIGAICDYWLLPRTPGAVYEKHARTGPDLRASDVETLPFMAAFRMNEGGIAPYEGMQVNFRGSKNLWAAYKRELGRLFAKTYLWVADDELGAGGFDAGSYFEERFSEPALDAKLLTGPEGRLYFNGPVVFGPGSDLRARMGS